MISSVALIRSSTFYAYLITKIGNRNLKKIPKKLALISPGLRAIVYCLSDVMLNPNRTRGGGGGEGRADTAPSGFLNPSPK